MHHVVKGIIVIRLEDTEGFNIMDNSITNIENLSVAPFTDCTFYHIGASSENLSESQAGNVRMISVAAVRGFDSTNKESEIKMNFIDSNCVSEVGNVIIGIDVQGDSKNTEVTMNAIDLKHNVFRDPDDQYVAIRVREVADDSVDVGGNICLQETQILNSNSFRGHERNLKIVHPHLSGDIEWRVGGCPLAADYAPKLA